MTFFLSFVPYIGAFVAGIPPVLLAYAGRTGIILGGSGAFIAMPLTLGILLFLHSFEETRALMETVIIRPEQSQKSIQEA